MFSHGGAIGDIIYHLPVVKHLGGGPFYILPMNRDGYRTKDCMQYVTLKPLLEVQPYIDKCGWSDVPIGICFDGWRAHLDFGKNLTDQVFQWLNLPYPDPLEPWLTVPDPKPIAEVVFVRSHQINYCGGFDWKMLIDHYKGRSVYLGHDHEHAAFKTFYGDVPHYPTKNMLEAAQVIAGAKLFISNATGLLAVAEGLKMKTIIASAPYLNHFVYYRRPNVQHCWEVVEPMELDP